MPAWLAYTYAAVAGVGALTILWSLRDGRAGNLMFDGGSICAYTPTSVVRPVLTYRVVLYGAAIYVYMHDVLPSECPRALTPVFSPTAPIDIFTNFTYLTFPSQSPSVAMPPSGSSPTHPSSGVPPFPAYLRGPTLQLASSHLVCSVVLTGVILLQAGRWWAEQADEDGDDEGMIEDGEEATTTRETTPAPSESKKTR